MAFKTGVPVAEVAKDGLNIAILCASNFVRSLNILGVDMAVIVVPTSFSSFRQYFTENTSILQ